MRLLFALLSLLLVRDACTQTVNVDALGGVGRELIDPVTGSIIIEPIGAGYEYGGNGQVHAIVDDQQQQHIDNRRFGTLDDAARAIGEHSTRLFAELLTILEALGIVLLFILLTVLASAYVSKVLLLLGVASNYVVGAVFLVDGLILVAGVFLAMSVLGIEPGEIFIGLGLASVALVKIVGDPATEAFKGFFVKTDSAYDVGQEITILSGRYRGIVHSKRLTEMVLDISSPLIGKPVEGGTPAAAAATLAGVAEAHEQIVIDPLTRTERKLTVTNNDYLHVSYSQLLAEERVFHFHHTTYTPRVLSTHRASLARMGMHFNGVTSITTTSSSSTSKNRNV